MTARCKVSKKIFWGKMHTQEIEKQISEHSTFTCDFLFDVLQFFTTVTTFNAMVLQLSIYALAVAYTTRINSNLIES